MFIQFPFHVGIMYHNFVMFLVMQNLCKICAKTYHLCYVLHLCKNVAQVQNGRLTPCRYGA